MTSLAHDSFFHAPVAHPAIIDQLQFTLEDLTTKEIFDIIQVFVSDVRATPPKLAFNASEREEIRHLKSLYSSHTTATNFGFDSLASYQDAMIQTARHYLINRMTSSSSASSIVPDLLGVRCFSLRHLGTMSSSEFDRKTILRQRIPNNHFYTRMSASALGMVVCVSHLDDRMLQERLALVFDPHQEPNPFQIMIVSGDSPLIAAVNTATAVDTTIGVELTEDKRVIPITSDIPRALARLEHPGASLEMVKACFSEFFTRKALTPFNPPIELSSFEHASGLASYASIPR